MVLYDEDLNKLLVDLYQRDSAFRDFIAYLETTYVNVSCVSDKIARMAYKMGQKELAENIIKLTKPIKIEENNDERHDDLFD